MYLENVCRICLRIPKNSTDLFVNHENLLNKINSISSVKIEINHGLPRKICDECQQNVNYIHNFQKLIKHTDCDLKSRLQTLTCTNNQTKPRQIRSIKQISTTTCNAIEISHSRTDTDKKEKNSMAKIRLTTKRQKIHNCSRCTAEFSSKHKLAMHRIQSHMPLIVCTICGAKFREYNYGNHMAIHSPPQSCNICGKMLKNASSLRYHRKTHDQPKYFCKICGRSYVLAHDYKRHYLKHTDPDLAYQLRSKPCSVCGKNVRGMKKHMLTHTGEKPHICSYCNKGFQAKYGLKVHIRQHTNERPYVCEHCGDTFAQTVSLRTHLKSKHGIVNKQETDIS